eukprot:8318743-Alexandrium_andersonii.AAC.1
MADARSGLAAAASAPLPPDLRQALVRTKFPPAGLYGRESSAADDAAIRRPRTAVLSLSLIHISEPTRLALI